MNDKQLRDIRFGILTEMYRVQPNGRSSEWLRTMLRENIDCDQQTIDAQVEFLVDEKLLKRMERNPLAPGIDPHVKITSDGMKFCEVNRLVP